MSFACSVAQGSFFIQWTQQKGGGPMLSLFLFLGYDFDLAITLSEAFN